MTFEFQRLREGGETVIVARLADGSTFTIQANLRDEEQRRSAVDRICEKFSGLPREAVSDLFEREAARPDEARQAEQAPHDFRPFPVDVFPDALREFIEFRSRADCVDPSFLALPTLSNLAGAIGNAAEIELKHGWVEPSVLWTANVGKSGSRKSVAMKHALDPLHRLQRKARKEYLEKLREYRRLASEYREQAKKASADPSVVLGDAPEKPEQRRHIATDTTAEALAAILARQEQGIVIARDELSGIVRSFNQYKARGGSDEAFWLALFDAQPVYIERKTGEPHERSIAIDRPAVSMTGGIQPGVLADVFTREQRENGLLARMLFAYPPDVEPVWNEEEPPAGIGERFARVFERLSSLPIEHWLEGGVKPRRLRPNEEARAMFAKFYVEHSRETMALDDAGSASYSKLLGICGRLALVLELARWASEEEPGLLTERVSAWAMEGAIRLARWFAHEALRVQALLSTTAEDQSLDGRELRIRRMGGRVSVRIWQRAHHRISSARAEAELDALAIAGRAHWLSGTGKSRVLRLGAPTVGSAPDADASSGASPEPIPRPSSASSASASAASEPSQAERSAGDEDPYAAEERAAIREHDAGIPGDEPKRKAG